MPFLKRPKCGVNFHIRPLDAIEWAEKFQSYANADGSYSIICFNCWKELSKAEQELLPPSADKRA